MSICPKCKGLIITVEQYEHGVRFQDYRCLMCGRYYPIHVVTAQVDVVKRVEEYKPWKRISQDTISKAKRLLDSGINITIAARTVGICPSSLSRVVSREGWQTVSGRPNRRKG